MPGTKEGALKAKETIRKQYGSEFWANIGKIGGKASSNGGFAADKKLAVKAGGVGGHRSSRTKKLKIFQFISGFTNARLVLDEDEAAAPDEALYMFGWTMKDAQAKLRAGEPKITFWEAQKSIKTSPKKVSVVKKGGLFHFLDVKTK